MNEREKFGVLLISTGIRLGMFPQTFLAIKLNIKGSELKASKTLFLLE